MRSSVRWLATTLLIVTGRAEDAQKDIRPDLNKFSICSVLSSSLPDSVYFPDDQVYQSQTDSYWAMNQGELSATCRVTPRSREDVQKAMWVLSRSSKSSTFAVKSGGHSAVANTSNVESGVVIDLELLNYINVDTEIGIVSIGPGARWADVYRHVDMLPGIYGVTGGRAGSVGIGGYFVGGGLSVFTGTHGWACDDVVAFEVVLGNGSIVQASHRSHQDLFKVIKGGGSNFGIVTRVKTRFIPLEQQIDVAQISYDWTQLPTVLEALSQYTAEADTEPETTVSVSIGGLMNGSPMLITVILTSLYNICLSKSLRPFFETRHVFIQHERRSQLDMAQLYDGSEPKGFREHRTTTTVRNDAFLLLMVARNFSDIIAPAVAKLKETGSQGGLLLQPLTLSHLRHSKDNMIGLHEEKEPLVLVSTAIRHSQPETDEKVENLLLDHMRQANELALRRGSAHAWRYLNYAGIDTDPFEHHKGDDRLWSFVLATKEKYDPSNVFGKQIQDPFRINS